MSEIPPNSADAPRRSPAKILVLTCGIGFALAVIAVTLASLAGLFWAAAHEEPPSQMRPSPRSERPSREIEEFTPVVPETEPADIFDDLESTSDR